MVRVHLSNNWIAIACLLVLCFVGGVNIQALHPTSNDVLTMITGYVLLTICFLSILGLIGWFARIDAEQHEPVLSERQIKRFIETEVVKQKNLLSEQEFRMKELEKTAELLQLFAEKLRTKRVITKKGESEETTEEYLPEDIKKILFEKLSNTLRGPA